MGWLHGLPLALALLLVFCISVRATSDYGTLSGSSISQGNDSCGNYVSCDQCVKFTQCVWCQDTASCFPGGWTGPDDGLILGCSGDWLWRQCTRKLFVNHLRLKQR